MKVNENCIGCGTCVRIAPDLFELKDGKAQLQKQPTTEEEIASFKNAQSACPVQAIED